MALRCAFRLIPCAGLARVTTTRSCSALTLAVGSFRLPARLRFSRVARSVERYDWIYWRVVNAAHSAVVRPLSRVDGKKYIFGDSGS